MTFIGNKISITKYPVPSGNHIPANFLEFQRVKLLAKLQFTGFFFALRHFMHENFCVKKKKKKKENKKCYSM